MRDGCSRKEKEEVTNLFLSIHRAVWRKVNSTVSDMKKQAPAARMVGEFAVKHVASEANKNIRKVTDPSPPASE
jgi:hypothetical protein